MSHPNRKEGEEPYLMVRCDGLVVGRVLWKEGNPHPMNVRMVKDDKKLRPPIRNTHKLFLRDENFVEELKPVIPRKENISPENPKEILRRLTALEAKLAGGGVPETDTSLPEPSVTVNKENQ